MSDGQRAIVSLYAIIRFTLREDVTLCIDEPENYLALESWDLPSLRREAAQVAASTGRVVESVTHDLIHDRASFQTGERGPQSPCTSDDAVQEYNQMIDEIEKTSAAA